MLEENQLMRSIDNIDRSQKNSIDAWLFRSRWKRLFEKRRDCETIGEKKFCEKNCGAL